MKNSPDNTRNNIKLHKKSHTLCNTSRNTPCTNMSLYSSRKRKKDKRFASVNIRKKFELTENAIKTIKNNQQNTHAINIFEDPSKTSKKISKLLLQKRQSENTNDPNFKLMCFYKEKYGYEFEQIDNFLHQFYLLCKVQELCKSLPVFNLTKDEDKKEKMAKRLLDITKITKEEFMTYDKQKANLKVNLQLVKLNFDKFKQTSISLFNRLLYAIEIKSELNEIYFENYIRLRYFLVDFKASQEEYINFALRFFNPTNAWKITISDIHKILKLALYKNSVDTTKPGVILKAIISNYLLCGIINEQGKFDQDIFENVHKKKKMDIMSLIQAILS